jgi:hypothetical protein
MKTLTTYLTNQGLEIKKNNSEEEVKIMKCGWPAGTANLYDDNFLKSLGQSDEEEPKDE